MKRLGSKMGWEIVEEERPDFKGEIFKDRPKHVVQMLENTVRKYPDKVGFIAGDWRLTFKEFDGIVNRIAAGLEKHGVKPGRPCGPTLRDTNGISVKFFCIDETGGHCGAPQYQIQGKGTGL